MKKIFITDLDGTLLQNDATLSTYARKGLEELIQKGVSISFATARSIVSVKLIMGDLPLRLPVVCSNGAYISDLKSGTHRAIQALPKPFDYELLSLFKTAGFHPFVCSWHEGRDNLYIEPNLNEGMRHYREDRIRAGDERLKDIENTFSVMGEKVICLNMIDRIEPLEEMQAELNRRFPEQLQTYIYQNGYGSDWYWLSVYDQLATKARAISLLVNELGYSTEHLTVFGDNLNDISMFEIARHKIATGNARPELKALATEVIDTNEKDSVIDYIFAQIEA
ncbi:MAG: HAD family hydrolase [Bacteroidia bacterium]|nr:HAD family hydrolase [Bacteroidia bacterium]